VSRDGPTGIVELRMSYLPARRTSFVTPGQHWTDFGPLGRRWERPVAQRCFGCHVTVLSDSYMTPEERFLGVGCEACHGPGQAHVAAFQAGKGPGPIEAFHGWGASRLNALCGQCHRTEQQVDRSDHFAVEQTQRMQPYGLMKSACFQKSGDRLSCVTCHDPHRNAETAPASYERVCRSCHGGKAGSTVCPVNQNSGCVRCHMPSRELGFVPGLAMADHWIRVYPHSSRAPHPQNNR
jgi:cytochrome c554/c'-like protein